jgi:hypothetical protein
MKLLILSLMASLVALPVSAQPSVQPSSTRNMKRINGSQCVSKLTNKAKKTSNVDCHHVVITGQEPGSTSMNFHFDIESERSGISYLVGSKLERDKEGRSFYSIIGVFTHKDGKPSQLTRASGICTMDTIALKDKVAACVAELPDGSSSASFLFK